MKKKTLKNKGGARKGAGRKPKKDKKKTVILYILESKIKEKGGEKELKETIYKFIN